MKEDIYKRDLEKTKINQAGLAKNKNLLYWHRKLLEIHLGLEQEVRAQKILEIGSGTSPSKMFYPSIITSDILPLASLDLCLDCMKIDECREIKDRSLDIILLTNVLHHLPFPIVFLSKAHKKLKKGGKIIITEPYYSLFSKLIYLFHHEKTDFSVKKASLTEHEGPLSSSNMALPQMIFFKKKEWLKEVLSYYMIDKADLHYYTTLSYFLTGGVSYNFRIPHFLYKLLFTIDKRISILLPKIFASFFTVTLKAL